jgi:N-acetylmuramoyl-L-alanine amidase
MKIVLSSGHGKHIRGASGILDEVDEARRVVDRVAELLEASGVGVDVGHDNVSTSQSANLDWIVDYHNGKTRDLDVSVHFNCYDGSASGCEVLYVTQEDLAKKVSSAICAASGFKNRGPKKRTDLAFLNGTEEPSILIETCFVDSQTDANIYKKSDKFEAICVAIAEAIAGIEISAPPVTTPPPITTPPPGAVVPTITITITPPGSAKVVVQGAAV